MVRALLSGMPAVVHQGRIEAGNWRRFVTNLLMVLIAGGCRAHRQ